MEIGWVSGATGRRKGTHAHIDQPTQATRALASGRSASHNPTFHPKKHVPGSSHEFDPPVLQPRLHRQGTRDEVGACLDALDLHRREAVVQAVHVILIGRFTAVRVLPHGFHIGVLHHLPDVLPLVEAHWAAGGVLRRGASEHGQE